MGAYGIAVVEILMAKEEELFILIIEPKIFLNYSTKKDTCHNRQLLIYQKN